MSIIATNNYLIYGQSFDEQISLYAHIPIHSQEISSKVVEKENQNPSPYHCSICCKKYKATPGLKLPTEVAHGDTETKHQCETCKKEFSTPEQLQQHISASHPDINKIENELYEKSVEKFQLNTHVKSPCEVKCTKCDKIFPNQDDLKLHLTEHKKKYECDSCKKCFRSKKMILSHLVKAHLNENKEKMTDPVLEQKKVRKKEVSLDKPFKCDVENCRYATSQMSLLKTHKFRHNPNYKCVTCKEKFKSRKELKTHMTTHGERPYKCDQCNKCYKDQHGLGWHKKVHHDPSRLKFTCEQCGKTYPFDSLLTQHINLTHAVQKQSVCDICGKNVSKSYLPMHRRTHGEKQYSCDVCQKKFLEKSYLKRHKMVHTGEKPYVCNLCGNLFRQHSTLTIHIRTHTGDRPYKCVLCNNAYKTHHNLKKHYIRSGHKMV